MRDVPSTMGRLFPLRVEELSPEGKNQIPRINFQKQIPRTNLDV